MRTARQRFVDGIATYKRFIDGMKWSLKHDKTKTEAEAKTAKAEIRECEKELDEATAKLKTGSFDNPLDKQIAVARAERLKAVKEYERQRGKDLEATRLEREKQALLSHKQAVEKAKEEGRPAPPPRKRSNGKQVSALDFLVR